MSNQPSHSLTKSISPFRATMKKENFFGLAAIVLCYTPLLPAEAFRFEAEERSDAAPTLVAFGEEKVETKAVEAPVAFGALKAEESADEESSSREDRQLGKKEGRERVYLGM